MNRTDILKLHKKQLSLEIDSIRLAIQHNAVKGAEAEHAFKRLLRKHLPQRYKLGSGFVVNGERSSRQHDIVVYDDLMNAPIYLEESAGAFLGGSVYGVIETTIAKFDSKKLEEDIEKIGHLRKIFPDNKVKFQKVESVPIMDIDAALESNEYLLQDSGCSPEDRKQEIREKWFTASGAFIGGATKLETVACEGELLNNLNLLARESRSSEVRDKEIVSPPPPRTYLCALNGTTYKSIDSLAKTAKRLTKKYGAHLHGLFIMNDDGKDWYLSTKAYCDYDIETYKNDDAFFYLLYRMRRAFQGMLVGQYPAAERNLNGQEENT